MKYFDRKNPKRFDLSKRIDIVCFCTLAISAILPLVGFGAYFRNEDARYLVWLSKSPGILDAFHLSVRYHPLTFRPASEIMLRIVYRLFGSNPLAFQATSGLLFIGAAVIFYKIVKLLFNNRSIAFLSVLVFFSCFYFSLHFLYTPIQGLQFPAELILTASVIFLLLKDLKNGRLGSSFIVSILLTVIAIFTHPVSAFLLPLLGITLIVIYWRKCREERSVKKTLFIALFALLWLTIPIVTKQGEAKLLGISAPYEYIPIMLRRYLSYSRIFLRGFNLVLITIPLFYSLSRFLVSRLLFDPSNEKHKLVVCSAIFVVAGLILVRILPREASFIVLSIVLLATAFIDRVRLFLVIWFFGGMAPILVSPVITGVYVRHAAMALSVVLGMAYWEIITEVVKSIKGRFDNIDRVFSLNRIAVFLTVIAAVLVIVAKYNVLRVPIVDRQIDQVNYLKCMGNNFRDMLIFLCERLDRDSRVYFFKGPSRKKEDGYVYTRTHLERLQPAKRNHYPFYFEIYGRGDIVVSFTDELSSGHDESKGERQILVATHNWEVDYMESNFSLETWKVFKRGNAMSKIYYYTIAGR